MDVCNNLDTITSFNRSVLTIGSFDGLHSGHIAVIKDLKQKATKNNCPSILITFHPHPKSILNKDIDVKWNVLLGLDKKIHIFEQYKIDYVLLVPFDKNFATLTANTFLENYIIKYFNPVDIVIGFNHHSLCYTASHTLFIIIIKY